MPVHSVRWSSDGTRLASASRRRPGKSRYADFFDVEELIQQWLKAVDRPKPTEEDGREAVRQMLMEGSKGDARIWEAETGATLTVYYEHPYGVNDVAWSPDGTHVVSAGGFDGTARIWNAASGETRLTLQEEAAKEWSEQVRRAMDKTPSWRHRAYLLKKLRDELWVGNVGWSPDGVRVISTQSRLGHVWDASTGRRLITYGCHRSVIQTLAIAPDGVRAVSGSNWIAQVWDAVVKGRALLIYRGHVGDGSDLVSLAWSPDGERVASGTSSGTVQVWDGATGEKLLTYAGHAPSGAWPITRAANAPWLEVSRRLAAAKAESPLPLIQATGRTYAVYALAWSPDGMRIASGGWDRLVRIWDAETGQHLATYGEQNALVTALDWSPDGGYIASGDRNGTVHLWPVDGAAMSGRSR